MLVQLLTVHILEQYSLEIPPLNKFPLKFTSFCPPPLGRPTLTSFDTLLSKFIPHAYIILSHTGNSFLTSFYSLLINYSLNLRSINPPPPPPPPGRPILKSFYSSDHNTIYSYINLLISAVKLLHHFTSSITLTPFTSSILPHFIPAGGPIFKPF